MSDYPGPASLEAALEEIYVLESLSSGSAAAEALVSGLRRRLAELRVGVGTLNTPSVLLLEGTDPLIAADGWKLDLVRTAGGVPIEAETEKRELSLSEIAAANPDAIVLAVPGADVSQALEMISSLEEISAWLDLRAVKEGIILVVDGISVLGRSSTRLGEAAEILAFGLHGSRVDADVSTCDAFQEVFWPGARGIELTGEIKSWNKARQSAWESAWRFLAKYAIDRANVAFELFRQDRRLDISGPEENVLMRTREMSLDVGDLEDHYFQALFSRLNDLAFSDRLRRRMRKLLAGPALDEVAVIDAITEVMAIHDPVGIIYYPENVDEYSIEAKAIASMAAEQRSTEHEVVEGIVRDVLVHYFSESKSFDNVDELVSEIVAILSHRRQARNDE